VVNALYIRAVCTNSSDSTISPHGGGQGYFAVGLGLPPNSENNEYLDFSFHRPFSIGTYRIIKEVAIDELDGEQPWFEREVFPISVSFKIVDNQ